MGEASYQKNELPESIQQPWVNLHWECLLLYFLINVLKKEKNDAIDVI